MRGSGGGLSGALTIVRSAILEKVVKNVLHQKRFPTDDHAVSTVCAWRATHDGVKIWPLGSAYVTSHPARSRLESLNARLTRLRAERSRLVARANHTERKRDTRRKILIGGAVLAAVQHEGVPALRSMDALTRWMDQRLERPHDRAAFDLPPAATAKSPTP